MTATRTPTAWYTYSTASASASRSEEHTSELQSLTNLVCRLLLEKKKKNFITSSDFSQPAQPAGDKPKDPIPLTSNSVEPIDPLLRHNNSHTWNAVGDSAAQTHLT